MKKILAIALAGLMLLSLCACGAAKTAVSEARTGTYDSYAAYDMEAAEEYGFSTQMMAPAPMAAASSAGGLAANGSAARPAGSASDEDAPETSPEKIIYSADVTVETTAFEEALQKVTELVERFGGWVESSSVNGANYQDLSRGRSTARSAGYTLRIPSERFEELMGSLSEIGNIPFQHVYTENVTARYYDVQARRNAYQVQEARLLELLEIAESVDDVLAIEAQLSEVRYQIESLEGTLRGWDRRVSYSTVYLQVSEVREYTQETPVVLSFGQRVARAFVSGWRSVAEFARGALLWLLESLPTLLLLAAAGTGVFLLIRRAARKRRAKRTAPKE